MSVYKRERAVGAGRMEKVRLELRMLSDGAYIYIGRINAHRKVTSTLTSASSRKQEQEEETSTHTDSHTHKLKPGRSDCPARSPGPCLRCYS